MDRRRSKKDPRQVRSSLGPDLSRTGNWTGSNSSCTRQSVPVLQVDRDRYRHSVETAEQAEARWAADRGQSQYRRAQIPSSFEMG